MYDHFGSYSLAFHVCPMFCVVGFVILLLMKAPVRKVLQPRIIAAAVSRQQECAPVEATQYDSSSYFSFARRG